MAEELAVAHMRHLGFADARRTAAGADGGLDVLATGAVAQVKHHAQPVGAPDVQRLRGAGHGATHAVFYSRSGYTAAAFAFAQVSNVALFAFTSTNVITAVNDHAERLEHSVAGGPLARLVEMLQEAASLLEQVGASSRRAQEALGSVQHEGFTQEELHRANTAIDDLVRFRNEVTELNNASAGSTERLLTAIKTLSNPQADDEDSDAAIAALVLEVHAQRELAHRVRNEQIELLTRFADACAIEAAPLVGDERPPRG